MTPLTVPYTFCITVSDVTQTQMFGERSVDYIKPMIHQEMLQMLNRFRVVKEVALPVVLEASMAIIEGKNSGVSKRGELMSRVRQSSGVEFIALPADFKRYLDDEIAPLVAAQPEILDLFRPKDASDSPFNPLYSHAVSHDFDKVRLEMDVVERTLENIRFLGGTLLALFEIQSLHDYQKTILTDKLSLHPQIVAAFHRASLVEEALAGLMGEYNASKIEPIAVGFDVGTITLNSPINVTVNQLFINMKGDKSERSENAEHINIAKQQRNIAVVMLVLSLVGPAASDHVPVAVQPTDNLEDKYIQDIRKGIKDGDCRLQQAMLKELEYYKGPIDGEWGNDSKKAAGDLCRSMGMVCIDEDSEILILALSKIMASIQTPKQD
ncbi:hypothetical protein [Echinimonas agarilytica]|uniref:Uncharacterized protein n=1 Tax=Echinimonas agarilytica TaxID=1215918 RepID=A0AA41W730_9GAMM|nr:hypothetical protein [Echinimonas agarilytica]MCM2680322.1 hypothetical protein [Echinimonas agarilytica]